MATVSFIDRGFAVFDTVAQPRGHDALGAILAHLFGRVRVFGRSWRQVQRPATHHFWRALSFVQTVRTINKAVANLTLLLRHSHYYYVMQSCHNTDLWLVNAGICVTGTLDLIGQRALSFRTRDFVFILVVHALAVPVADPGLVNAPGAHATPDEALVFAYHPVRASLLVTRVRTVNELIAFPILNKRNICISNNGCYSKTWMFKKIYCNKS